MLPPGEGVDGNPLIQSKAVARRAAVLAALPVDRAALYGFFVASPRGIGCIFRSSTVIEYVSNR